MHFVCVCVCVCVFVTWTLLVICFVKLVLIAVKHGFDCVHGLVFMWINQLLQILLKNVLELQWDYLSYIHCYDNMFSYTVSCSKSWFGGKEQSRMVEKELQTFYRLQNWKRTGNHMPFDWLLWLVQGSSISMMYVIYKLFQICLWNEIFTNILMQKFCCYCFRWSWHCSGSFSGEVYAEFITQKTGCIYT